MTMTSRLLLLLLCLLGDFIDIGGVVSGYEMFGMRDPWNVKLDLPQHSPLLPDANNTVFLINDAVDNDGDLFAFTAEIHHISPIWFQIWRPVLVPADSYELIAYRQVIPSVEEQFEDFYMLGDRCIHVKRGDRLGLVFNTVASPVYYGVYQFHYRTSIQHLPKVGDRLQFNHDLKVRFVATGFVNVNPSTSSNPASVRCTKGLRIIVNGSDVTHVPSTTTTYLPPTGIPGRTGPRGPMGATGRMGAIGMKGPVGATGPKGVTGKTGPAGPTGPKGADFDFKGAVGEDGKNGSRGKHGATGEQGAKGTKGERGPRGRAGRNEIETLYGPYRYDPITDYDYGLGDERWWAGIWAIRLFYICLGVASLILLLTLVFIIVTCCQCCAVQRSLKKYSDI